MCLLQKECKLEETQYCCTLLMECTGVTLGEQHADILCCAVSQEVFINNRYSV